MSVRAEFATLADLLRQTQIYLDSLVGDSEVAEAMSEMQQAQADELSSKLGRVEEVLRRIAAIPPTVAQPVTE